VKKIAFPQVGAENEAPEAGLERYAWLSIAAAVVTIGLKTGAFALTGSVGLLSDAAESLVNLGAGVIALVALRVATRPPDYNHDYGHGKAEYFSAGAEGLMIFVAAGLILYSAVHRLLHPVALESLGWGLLIVTAASVVNGLVAMVLLRAGRAHRSVTLIADGKHLLTDVVTSAGVIVGVLLVALTGWAPLDPLVAIVVGVNILITGYRLISSSVTSLLDAALPAHDMEALHAALDGVRVPEVEFGEIRTRESGRQRFVSLTVRLPGHWTVERAHEVTDRVEQAICRGLPGAQVQTHVAPAREPGVSRA
jgi:cation diffusion facilitator family transporter